MPEQVPERWSDLQTAFELPTGSSILVLGAMLLLGGVLAMYLRLLYGWAAPRHASGSIARVFPLLTLVTIAVIAVVKGSLALSLGLVGALSIVRFRAAIKDPEELVYLFLCIGVGLSLGAVQVWLAVALVVAASIFALLLDRVRPSARRGDAFLSVTGEAERYFGAGDDNALVRIRKLVPKLTVERCEIDGDEGHLRLQLHRVETAAAPELLAKLRQDLPDCRVSFINAELLP